MKEKELLAKIFAAQVVIYDKLVVIEKKQKGVTSSSSLPSRLQELNREIEKILSSIE